jgi:hypothetical protein
MLPGELSDIAQLLPARRVELEECEQLCRTPGKSVVTAKANGSAPPRSARSLQ